MKILFSPIDSEATSCQRIIYPLRALEKAKKDLPSDMKVEIDVLNTSKLDEQLKWADLVVLQCLIGMGSYSLVEQIKASNKKIVIDYDDNFSALPENIREILNLPQTEITENWKKYLQIADLITVSTNSLAQVVKSFTENHGGARRIEKVRVLPNLIRRSDHADSYSYMPWDSDEFRIIYSCSESHLDDIKYISPVLNWASKLYSKIVIISQGGIDFTYLNSEFKGKAAHQGKVPFDSYLKTLREIKPHIFIAPLLDTPHNVCRSNLKYLQSGLLKCPFICNNLPPYTDVKHGITGFKSNSKLKWLWFLRKLVKDKNLMINLGQNAYQHSSKFILENHIDLWYETYKKLLEK